LAQRLGIAVLTGETLDCKIRRNLNRSMKTKLKLVLTVLWLTSVTVALGQQNTIAMRNFDAKPDGAFFDDQGTPLAGDAYLVQLYGLSLGKGLIALGKPITFNRGNGYFSDGIVEAPVDGWCAPAWVQVRAWASDGGATFEEAALAGAWTGASKILFLPRTGCFTGGVPFMPASLDNLKYPGAPIIVKQPEPQTVIQARAKITLSVVASSGVKATYQWHQEPSDAPGGLIWGANSPTYSPPNLKQDTAFWVTVHNSAGSVTSDRATVLVHGGDRPWLRVHWIGLNVHLILEGKPGSTYAIQYAESLAKPVKWKHLKNRFLEWGVASVFDFFDPEQPSRFYRAIEVP
jgi:hypothetical protein